MNRWNQLLELLDKLFGFIHIKNSSVKKLKQYYDEKINQHVFLIEYRCVIDENPKKTEHKKHEQRRIE